MPAPEPFGLRLVRQRQDKLLARRAEAACGHIESAEYERLRDAAEAAGVRKLSRPARIGDPDGGRRGVVIDERLRADDG